MWWSSTADRVAMTGFVAVVLVLTLVPLGATATDAPSENGTATPDTIENSTATSPPENGTATANATTTTDRPWRSSTDELEVVPEDQRRQSRDEPDSSADAATTDSVGVGPHIPDSLIGAFVLLIVGGVFSLGVGLAYVYGERSADD